jgi:ABC-type polysaccharide/polyol phosphate export permease
MMDEPTRGHEATATKHDLSHVPMVDPADTGGLLSVFRKRHLLRLMVKRELRARYIDSKFGLAWSYINPISRFFTFYFVFGIIIGRGAIPHFAIHLFAGMVLMNLFTESFNAGTRSIMANKAVVQKMPLPREIFPAASVLVSLYHTGPQLVVLVVACLATGSFSPDPVGILAALMAFGIVILLAIGMAIMFAAINVMYRDFTRGVQIITNMLPFTVPMMYPYTIVKERFGDFPVIYHLYLFNPLAEAVLLIQRGFWITTVSDEDARQASDLYGFKAGLDVNFPPHLLERGLIFLGISVAFVVFAQWVFSRLDDRIPDRLL